MAARLPPDILHLICEELGYMQEFPTLFNCAISSKQLASSALLWLYRIHTRSPIRSGESNEIEVSTKGSSPDAFAQLGREQRAVSKWAVQWRSIILSSLGCTAYPYCLYIHSLELSNLSELFQDYHFFTEYNAFFADEMEVFLRLKTPESRPKKIYSRYEPKLAIDEILDLIGESISKYTAQAAASIGGEAALLELSGEIRSEALARWVSRFSRLKSLRLWDGAVLNKTTATSIRANCHDFNSLTLLRCKGDEVDTDLADFFFGLRPNTMKSLQMISSNDLGSQTFLALSSHGDSLNSLILRSLEPPALRSLYMLKGCKSLQTLTIELDIVGGSIDLQAVEKDSYMETIAWLTSCVHLKSIRLLNVLNGPTILTSICLQEKIKLESLVLVNYELLNNQDFHLALTHQPDLTHLELRADASGAFKDDIDTLVASLCTLKKLKYLNIIDTSEYFSSPEIVKISENLKELEDVTISGYNMHDSIWTAVSSLHKLRALSFQAITTFTFDGILGYISTLRPSNAGLDLSIMCAHIDSGLSSDEIAIIKTELANKVDGKFQFMMWRDPAESQFDSDSD